MHIQKKVSSNEKLDETIKLIMKQNFKNSDEEF